MHEVVEKLSKAIQIPTVSYTDTALRDNNAFGRWEEFIGKAFPTVHNRLMREKPGDLAIVFAWEGSNHSLDPAAILAHYDVVPAGDEGAWSHPPFGGEIADGFIWGRGAIDDKLSDITLLQALEELLLEGVVPERTIYFCFGGDEEIGGTEGASAIVRWFQEREIRLSWVLDEGGAVTQGMVPGVSKSLAMVGLAEKGHINVRLTARGSGGHASTPPAETAVSRLAAAIRRVVAHPFPRRLTKTVDAFLTHIGREVTGIPALIFRLRPLTNPIILKAFNKADQMRATVRTTQAVTVVSGGTAENVLPPSAEAIVNIRLLHGDTIESALEHLRGVINDPMVEVDLHGSWGNIPAVEETPADHPLLKLIEETVNEVYPGVPVIPYLMTGSTDSSAYTPVTKNIFRFVPMQLNRDELGTVHNVDERISIENVERCLHFYRTFLKRAGQEGGSR